MFKRKQIGPERGDATAPYAVMLDHKYTVREFIEEVLIIRDEWGYVGIHNGRSIFGKPCCTYQRQKLLSKLPEEYLNKTIFSVSADGGWTRMDYLIKVMEEKDG